MQTFNNFAFSKVIAIFNQKQRTFFLLMLSSTLSNGISNYYYLSYPIKFQSLRPIFLLGINLPFI